MKRQKENTPKPTTATSRPSARTLEYAEAPRLSPPLYILLRQKFLTERLPALYKKAMREDRESELFQEYGPLRAAESEKWRTISFEEEGAYLREASQPLEKPRKWGGGYYMRNFEAVVDEEVKKEKLEAETEVEKEAVRERIRKKIIVERTEHLKDKPVHLIPIPRRRGRPPMGIEQRYKLKRAVAYQKKTGCSWRKACKIFLPEEFQKDPNGCISRTKTNASRI